MPSSPSFLLSVRSSARLGAAVLLCAAPVCAACAAGPGDNATGAGSSTGGNASNGGGTTTFGDGGGGQGEGAGFNSGGGAEGGGCAGEDYVAEKVPLDIYLMLDQSGSMSDGSPSRWDAVVGAITAFVQSPSTAGVGVGIQYFPLESGNNCSVLQCYNDADCGAGCGPCMGAVPQLNFPGICQGFADSDSCNTVDYATPDVEIGPLPANGSAIVQSMSAHGPTGGTPTSAALQGAIDHAKAWANFNVGHKTIVVLATDGDPTSCNDDLGFINGIAAAGVSGTPSILTFVIGVGGSVGALNGFAAAGGTSQAFMIDQSPDVEQAFLDALLAIQGAAIPCAFLIPEPPPGEDIDFGQINVNYTPANGTPDNIPRVDNSGACPADGLAWYYDDNQAPTQIFLCPATCTTISADTEGSVKIVVGCETVVR
ncbi:MAG: VWA domain-containing protein [Polyangiaceae bacterium]|nr:VWA domain-containing protein [Polyangiaceae bacterium]MBK8941524.1 VWA domain-containing protein [Polyangiaceae bacterium]